MNAPDILAAVANRIEAHKSALTLEGVSYPVLNTVPSSPWLMVRQSRNLPTRYEKRATTQIVHLSIELIILVATQQENQREEQRIDGLVEPVLDLFDATAVGGNINHAFPDLPEPIDRIWQDAPVVRQPVQWGEQFCYAAYITLDAQFSRKPHPIGGTP